MVDFTSFESQPEVANAFRALIQYKLFEHQLDLETQMNAQMLANQAGMNQPELMMQTFTTYRIRRDMWNELIAGAISLTREGTDLL